MRIKQSLCLPMYVSDELTVGDLCKAVAGIGYPAVEIWGRGPDFNDVVAAAKDNGLVLASMVGADMHPGGLSQRSQHKRMLAELRESIDVAVEHDIPNLIVLAGNRVEGLSDEDAIDITAEGLGPAAPYAERKSVNLNLELLNSKVDHPGYQADHTEWGVAVCEKIASPRVKVLYDIYHMQIMEGDVIRTIRENIRWIGHFHTAGNPGRGDMDDTQELNYVGICRAIAETGYEHYVGHEFKPKGDTVEALRRAFEICDQG